ncbi:MAG: Smr/MutS family protein [Chloroflexota bacterium]
MDQKTYNTLEFDKVRQRLADYTSFSAGRQLALDLQPATEKLTAVLWQTQTSEARDLLDSHTDITIGGARDVRRFADNTLRGFTLRGEELLDIRNTLVAARTLRRHLLKLDDQFPHLAEIADLIEECPGLVSAISHTFDDRGEVADSASSKLASVRQQQRVVHGRIQDKLQSILSSTLSQHLQEPIISMRNGRYVLPVKIEAKGRVKGIVHDQSGSGATVWLEPLVTVDLNNEYRGLLIEEEKEIERILAELSAQVADQAEAIKRIVERVAELDLIFARAQYAGGLRAVQPEFVSWRTFPPPRPPKHANERAKWTPPPPNPHPGSTIWIKGARHPLLDQQMVVPTDLTLDEETFIVLITGPNTGGKTVSLKTMGLMVLMAQAGLHLPAGEARLTMFEDVFADIGDEQSIEQNLSTFSGHMTNIVRILGQVNERSLVLLDELGSGTDPAEGAALAQAIVGYLRDKGATTFVATHYPELKWYASQTEGATNASLLFDVDTLEPTYEMSIGIPGKSNAFAIARRLGLEQTILDEGLALVGAGSREAENMLDSIYELREKIQSEEAATNLALRRAESERDQLAQRLEAIEAERRRVLEEAQAQAEAELEEIRAEISAVRQQVRGAASLNQLKKLGKEVDQIEAEQVADIAPVLEKPGSRRKKLDLEVGDIVKIIPLNTKGEVATLSKKEATVIVGQMQMKTKLHELEFVERPQAITPEPITTSPRSASPGMELDMRGMRVEEGLMELEHYLDGAFLARLPWARLIHGKGTGRLRDAVRQALDQNPHVLTWEEGKDGEGGAGVTVAKFEVEE